MTAVAYIAGPMSGLPAFNFPTFDEVAESVRLAGWEAVNPAEHDRETHPDIEQWPAYTDGDTAKCPEFDYAAAMKWDITQIVTRCTAIVLLPGWRFSTGATVEKSVAEICGLDVVYAFKAYPRRPESWYVAKEDGSILCDGGTWSEPARVGEFSV